MNNKIWVWVHYCLSGQGQMDALRKGVRPVVSQSVKVEMTLKLIDLLAENEHFNIRESGTCVLDLRQWCLIDTAILSVEDLVQILSSSDSSFSQKE